MKRKEGAFMVAQAAIFVGVLALVSLPVQSANETASLDVLSGGGVSCVHFWGLAARPPTGGDA